MFEREGNGLEAALGFEGAEPCEAQNVASQLRVLRVVVNDEYEFVRHNVADLEA